MHDVDSREQRVAAGVAKINALLLDPAADVTEMRKTLIKYSRYQAAADVKPHWSNLQDKLNEVLALVDDAETKAAEDARIIHAIVAAAAASDPPVRAASRRPEAGRSWKPPAICVKARALPAVVVTDHRHVQQGLESLRWCEVTVAVELQWRNQNMQPVCVM